jgi:hypothetical protein
MEVALDACRETASRALPLDLVALSAWQRAVLPGSTAELRRTDAFAKAGRERYAVTDDLATAFEAALSEAEDPSLPVLVRAARLYLDVCYFHPFADGNARAARLALDHFLTSRGLGLRGLHPILLPWRVDIDPLPVLTGILTTVVGPCPWIETTRRLT